MVPLTAMEQHSIKNKCHLPVKVVGVSTNKYSRNNQFLELTVTDSFGGTSNSLTYFIEPTGYACFETLF